MRNRAALAGVVPSIMSPTAAMVTESIPGAAGVTALPAAGQAASTSRAADPVAAQNALTVFRMRINLAKLASGNAVRCALVRALRLCGWAGR